MLASIWVEGRPATFATRDEAAWKENIALQVGNRKSAHNSLEMGFYIHQRYATLAGFDLDNLCDPVFSTLASRLHWFDGRQSNITGWKAKKAYGPKEGVLLNNVDRVSLDVAMDCILFDSVYPGAFPKCAQDPEIPAWLYRMEVVPTVAGPCGLALLFGPTRLSIASLSDGVVKHVMDCLYPILGGKPGSPYDHMIYEMRVQKGCDFLLSHEIRIVVYTLDK